MGSLDLGKCTISHSWKVQFKPSDSPRDKSLSSYVFRMCLTNLTSNRVPFSKPPSYNATEYLLWSRYVEAGGKILTPEAVVPNFKTDTIGSTAFGLGFDLTGRTDGERFHHSATIQD